MTRDEVVDPARGGVGRDLPAAILVGVVLAGLFLASIFWRPGAFATIIAVVAWTALLDADRALRPTGLRLLLPALLVATPVMMAATLFAGPRGQAIGMSALVGAAVVQLLADRRRRDVVATLGATWLFGVWVIFLASFGVLLADRGSGPVIVLGVIGAAIFTDIGGYVFGVALGRHKVAPSVSPNKTWEGLLGGLAVSGGLAAIVLPAFGDTFTATAAAALAVLCGLASFVGDLTESMIKRDLGVKDLGDLLPGHGGMLDRVDGILFAMPVGYYLVEFFL